MIVLTSLGGRRLTLRPRFLAGVKEMETRDGFFGFDCARCGGKQEIATPVSFLGLHRGREGVQRGSPTLRRPRQEQVD